MTDYDPYTYSRLYRARRQKKEGTTLPQNEAVQSGTGNAEGTSRATTRGAGQDTSQEHVVVHMRPGEVYRAFIRLVHKAATLAHTHDESLPNLSADQAPYRYIIIKAGQQTPQNGFCSDMAPGMIVRKVCINKPAFYTLQTHPHNAVVERDMIKRRGVNVHRRTVKKWLSMFPHGWARAQRLTPAAVPVSLMPHISAQIATYNANLPAEKQLMVYLEDVFRQPAAAVSIQSAWRSCLVRRELNLTERTLHHRAALCIQRAWRSHLFLSHARCLDAASVLMDSMSALTLMPTLCLTLLSARMLGLASQRRASCLPLQRLQWGYLSEGGGIVLLAHSAILRVGVPHWLRCEIPVVPWELVSVRGHPLVPDQTAEDRRKLLDSPRWAYLKWLANAAALLDLKYAPSGSSECVGLLQKNVKVKQVQGANVSELDMEALMPDAVLRMLTFRSRDEAKRRALLLFFVTWDPAYNQAAELVPLSLSTAMSRQQTKAAAIYNDGDDADLPALFSPGGDDSEPLRRRMALMIALSLPGASKLAPFIHSIAGGQTSVTSGAPVGDPPGTTRRKSTVHAKKRASMAPRPSTFKFLQPVPDSFDATQDPETNLLLKLERSLDQDIVHSRGTPEGAPTPSQAPPHSAATQHARQKGLQYSAKPPQSSASAQPGAVARSQKGVRELLESPPASQTVQALMAGEEVPVGEDLILSQTSTGYIERASTSIAEVEIRHIMSELGPDRIQESPVYRALAGAFGRLQQSEHEAFLHMRTADLLTRKRVIVEAVQQMPAMMPRHTAVGHSLAPGYVPATMASMACSVDTLKHVWRQRNIAVVDTIKQARKLALESMHDEVVARRAKRYDTRCQERAQAAAVFAGNADAQHDAARCRKAAVRARKQRSRAVCCAKARARTVGASLAAEARAVRHADRYAAMKQAHKRMQQEAEDQWQASLIREEEADVTRAAQFQLKKAAAAEVRDSGYTRAVHQVYADKAQELSEKAASARIFLNQGKAMVGPAGGLWGSCPPQVLLEPYPTSTIVTAAENEEPEQDGDSDDPIAAFADLQPSMIKRVYNDFLTCTAGVDATFAAKVAFGSYVGLPDIPFGSTDSRVGGQTCGTSVQ